VSSAAAFRRDRTTWLAYAALASYTFCLYALGPMLAFLRDELHLSYTVTSLHSSLWAAGTVVTGLSFSWLVRVLGRYRLFWLGAAGTAIGLVLVMVGHAVVLTLLAAAWLGTSGTMLQTGSISLLSQRHGERRDRAFVEATVGGSAAAVLAPLVLGLGERSPVGWRAGFLLPLLALAILYVLFGRLELPTGQSAVARARRRLPADFWGAALLVSVVVGLEFCLVFYAPQMLKAGAGLPTSQAATVLSLFYVGELAGRAAAGGLTRRPGRAVSLTLVGLALTAAGVLALWLSGRPWLAIPGLLVAGLGVANLYPLSLALALGAAAGQTDLANARVQLLTGIAVLSAPLLLGSLADTVGVTRAFALVLALIALALLLLWMVVSRPSRPAAVSPEQPR
jgi:MFS family permease